MIGSENSIRPRPSVARVGAVSLLWPWWGWHWTGIVVQEVGLLELYRIRVIISRVVLDLMSIELRVEM